MTTTVSSREFNQDLGRVKRAARSEPVFITDRGNPAFVLMSHEQYQRLTRGETRSIVDMLRQDDPEADFDFDPPRLEGPLARPEEY